MTVTIDEFRAFRDNVFAKFANIRADIARLRELIPSSENDAEIRNILASVEGEAQTVADIEPEA